MSPASPVKLTAVPLSRLLLLLVLAAALPAQDIIMSAPHDPVLPTVLRELQPPTPSSMAPPTPDTPYKIGPLVLHPRLSYSYLNAGGLPTPGGGRVDSEIHTVSAGLSTDLGRHWTLAYNPTWVNYTVPTMSDSFDQSISLSGAGSIQDLGFQISENYAASSPTLVETGGQTKQKTWATSLSSSYSLNSRLQIQASTGVNERYSGIAPRARSWTGSTSVSLSLSPRTSLNLGPSYSYTELKEAPDVTTLSYSARLNWNPTRKLTLGLSTGMQRTDTTSSAPGSAFSRPQFNYTLGYQIFETTSLSLAAARTVTPSFFKDQVTESLNWNAGIQQRLLGRFYLSADYSRHTTDYSITDDLGVSVRKDVVEAYSVRLSTTLFSRLSVSTSFSHTENKSSRSGFSFSSEQYGMSVGWSY